MPSLTSGRTRLSEFAGASVMSPIWERNEDVLGTLPLSEVFLIADGIGGEPQRLPAAQALASFQRFFLQLEGGPAIPLPADPLAAAMCQVNRDIYEDIAASPDGSGMGCTLAALRLGTHWDTIVHAGACRIYRYRKQELERLTVDHMLWLHRLQQGDEQAEVDGLRNQHSSVITQALGVQSDIPIDLHYICGEKGDLYLLCSDELTGALRDDQISAVLARKRSSLAEYGKLLVEKAHSLKCCDNASVLLVRRLS